MGRWGDGEMGKAEGEGIEEEEETFAIPKFPELPSSLV